MTEKHFNGFGNPYDPSFGEGIVCTGSISKSESLEAFLDYVQFRPTRIIFIDDNKDNLADVSHWAKSKNIDFVGIHYREADRVSSKFPFSKERARLQLDTVVEKDR
ncbi:MAG: DUF2608 domain-containing protein [Puniceicoccales bacterium]|nr:DUF2608 domain-containing protein [Puniceicoccales bacterium]